MPKHKTLLVHPDPMIRASLRCFLDAATDFVVLGEAVTSFEALEMRAFIPYEVFFLGTELPFGVRGVEVAAHLLKEAPGALVLLAADEQDAFAAFELGVTDYLRWPVDAARFAKTLERLRGRFALSPAPLAVRTQVLGENSGEEETLHLPLGEEEETSFVEALRQAWDVTRDRPLELEKLPVSRDGCHLLIPYTEIVYAEADEDYSLVHTVGDRYLTSHRLKHLEERLRPHRFCRVHRKYLVNLEMVTEIASMPGGGFVLRTAGRRKIELPVSRRRFGELKKILQL